MGEGGAKSPACCSVCCSAHKPHAVAISTAPPKFNNRDLPERVRRLHSTYQKVVQGKCPLNFLHFNGVVCSNTLFSNTSALTNSLLFRANSTRKILEPRVWSNTSGFQFWGLLLEQTFCRYCAARPKRLRLDDKN